MFIVYEVRQLNTRTGPITASACIGEKWYLKVTDLKTLSCNTVKFHTFLLSAN